MEALRMNKGAALFAIALLAVGAAVLWNGPRDRMKTVQGQGTLHLQPCSPGSYAKGALCGTYEVWEDRKAETGRKIGLNVVVLPARGANRAGDPVFWLEGGPGAAATDSARDEAGGLFRAVRETRDLVFVDQRGTGGSNGLQCSFNDDPSQLRDFLGALFPREKVRACRERLEQRANLRLYTTPVAMDDLDEVREALGYDKINLAGASYGTFAAQIYMRQHPEHVRSAFLVGVATPNIKQPLLFPRAAQLALDEVFKDCAADQDCHANFPGLRKSSQR
jgi:pimeloyl-ACP methyl ester carboxylesterase